MNGHETMAEAKHAIVLTALLDVAEASHLEMQCFLEKSWVEKSWVERTFYTPRAHAMYKIGSDLGPERFQAQP
jgi:hypothetical protein